MICIVLVMVSDALLHKQSLFQVPILRLETLFLFWGMVDTLNAALLKRINPDWLSHCPCVSDI